MSVFLFLISMILNIQPTVTWHHTVIEIPLNEEVAPYFLMPYVTLANGNQVIETTNITYERGVNRTFLSVVNSRDVKSFFIDYRVHFLDYGITNVQTIEFKIVDLVPPTITWTPTFEIEVGSKLPKYEILIQIKDNYDEANLLNIQLDTSFVNVNRVGNYPLFIDVFDTSYNISHYTFELVIYDRKAPTIERIKSLVLDIDQEVNFNDYFKFTDNALTHLNVVYELQKKSIQVGHDMLKVCVSDESDNVTCETFEVQFQDQTPPQLEVISYIPKIEVWTPKDEINYEAWITYMKDNTSDTSNLDLKVFTDLNLNQIGKYYVKYELKDESLNTTIKSIYVEVVDTTPPEVIQLAPLTLEVHSVPNYQHFFEVRDNWTETYQIKTTYHTTSQLDQIGIFQLEVKVKDTNQNERIYFYDLYVLDTTPPLILSEEEIFIFDFMRPNYNLIIHVTDNFDEYHALNIQILDDNVNYLVPGIYDLEVIVSDTSSNQSRRIIHIILLDVIPPVISLVETRIDLQINDVMPIWTQYIMEVTDNISHLIIEDVVVTHSVNMRQIGMYEVIYQVKDDSLNETQVQLKLYINDASPPVILSQPLLIQAGQSYDLTEGLSIFDDLNTQIIIDQDNLNDSKSGTYEVVYYVYDERGNYTTHHRVVKVEDHTLMYFIIHYLPIIIIALSSLIMSYVMYQKYHKIDFDKHSMIKYNEFEETIEGE
jgi:hypothetical protein